MSDFKETLNDALDKSAVKAVEDEWQRSPWERLAKVAFIALGTLGANILLEKAWDKQFRPKPQPDFIDVDIVE